MGEVMWLCGKFRVDDALSSKLCCGCRTWCSVDGQTGFHKENVDAVSPYFAFLVEVAAYL